MTETDGIRFTTLGIRHVKSSWNAVALYGVHFAGKLANFGFMNNALLILYILPVIRFISTLAVSNSGHLIDFEHANMCFETACHLQCKQAWLFDLSNYPLALD